MGNKIRVILALVFIVGVAYMAFNSVRERSYSGAGLSFDVGSGTVTVANRGNEAVPVEMRAMGRTSSFRVESNELELKSTSKREGSGRNAYHTVSFEIPAGTARIDVTRGSAVKFMTNSSQPLDAVVTPKDADGVQMTLGFAGFFILIALYYISKTLEHRWVGALRNKISARRGKRVKGHPA